MNEVINSESALSINIHVMGMPFDGTTIATKSLGGSETAAYYLARGLAARGHRVNCWTNIDKESTADGVRYVPIGAPSQKTPLGENFEHYARNTPHDVLIIQRAPHAFHKPFASKLNIWQLHDLALHRSASQMMGGMWHVDAVTCVSQFHADQVKKVWNVNPTTLEVVRNGVDLNLYGGPLEDLGIQWADGLRLLYQSRPERGLEHLLRPGGIMARLAEDGVKATLYYCSYDNTTQQMAPYYAQLDAWAAQLPNVRALNALSKPQLASLQRQCDLLVYPTEFEEVSCITVMEATAAGLPVLTSHHAAIPETLGPDAGAILIDLKDGAVSEDEYVHQLKLLAEPGTTLLADMRKEQLALRDTFSWDNAVDTLESICMLRLQAKSKNVGAVLRHAIEHSDIDFARWVGNTQGYADTIARSALTEINRMYAFTRSDEAYAAHYAKHQTAYYDEFEDRVIGEDVTHSTRFRGVLSAVAEIRNKQLRPSKILDYGCAHGHYSIPLARTFTDSEVVGVDISDRAVSAARKWAARDQVANARFYSINAGGWEGEKYDVIIAAEVLEHVRDDKALMNKLAGMLAPDGAIIFTTPNGRWEWTGTVPFRTGREHLRHYERKDIEDLCADNEHQILHAPASHDPAYRALGSWVWTVYPTKPFGEIDYARKLREYAPRQTVSACIIVKDGDKTLRKCVESFIDYVDEVRIFIDPKTKDRTMDVCQQMEADFPNRPFFIAIATKSATTDGFDEARNESIADAAGDWILWIDADEELRGAERMHLFMRPSMHGGYGFPQLHYSADPEQVLTTDFPCRLFRNHLDVKFYGVVHEHPETEIGKAVPWSIVRHEMKFLHNGYVDEDTRRKRYERNLPLLMRDRVKYPQRQLNSFLMLRDIAQGLMFEQQQTGGALLPHHDAKAREGIKIMEGLIESKEAQSRMLSDCIQYYSHCVVTTGSGFDAEIDIKTRTPAAPDLAASISVKGRFHSREFYHKVLTKFSEESIKQYEDRYL